MNRHRIITIIRKEWEETIRNRTIVWTFLFLLVLLTLLPLVLAFVIPPLAGDAAVNDPDLAALLDLLTEAFPEFATLDPVAQFQVYILRQFVIFFLLLPIMLSMSIATYSIIGEKTSRSLEALLATPVRTDELLIAKSVAAALPAVAGTWLAFLFLALVTRVVGGAEVYRFALDSAAWGTILLIAPLVALLGLGLGVIVSSRASDPRSAQQVGGLLVLPVVALLVGQVSGLFLLGLPLVLLGALILLLVDLAVLYFGVTLFNREAILTRWQ